MPSTKRRIISVTHYIPYTCVLINDSTTPESVQQPNGKLANGNHSPDVSSPDTPAAPVSRLPECRRQASTTVHEDKTWKFKQRRGHSAMYSGIGSLQREWEYLHIGWTGAIYEDANGEVIPTKNLASEDKLSLTKALKDKGHIVPIFLDDAQSAGHYEGYCKSVLWPLFHYILWSDATDGRIESMNWSDYTAVNKHFTDAIVDNYQPGDI
ncbi:glycosyltransferase family 20-domain-containing protein, partial [Jimgerdemannia flammicorona]